MKIQYCSDLHIEFPENKEYLIKYPLEADGDILILAGDIVPFKVLEDNMDFFKYCSDNFEATFWIPGNHEYYYSDINSRSGKFQENIFDNVKLLNNNKLKFRNVDFIFSTLWTNIGIKNQWRIENSLNDFRLIRNKDIALKSYHYNKLHKESIEFIDNALSEVENKSVVVSHHVPTFYKYPEKYKGDVLNEAFGVELYDLIESKGPDFWIYGHSHFNTQDFTIGKTSLRTNQLGYVRYEDNKNFRNDKITSI